MSPASGGDEYRRLVLPDVREMVQTDDRASMAAFCDVLHPVVVAEILDELQAGDVWQVLEHAPLDLRVEIFEYMSLRRQTELVESLDRRRLSELVEAMSADDRVDLLSRMPQDRVNELLKVIAQAERNDIRRLLSYHEDSAGAVMTTEYASLPAEITARDALDQLRIQAPDSETIYYIYILSETRRLDGLISLRELILARPDARLENIMQRDVIRMKVDDPAEDVAQELARYDFIAMPIVDAENRLVGIVTHDDAIDVVQEAATEDAYRQGAVEPLQDGYEDTPMLTILWKRGVWLLFLSFVALITAKVLDGYQEATAAGGTRAEEAPAELARFILLFLPLVMASGGNAGSQSATLFIRMFALRTGEGTAGLDTHHHRRLTLRELMIAAVLGGSLASLDFLVAWLGFGLSIRQAGAIALTVQFVVMLGTTAGTLLPMIFKNLGMDPAIMSNPLISALVDIFGVIIFYETAMLIL